MPHVEFAYNRAEHSTTKVSPFKIVYGFNPVLLLIFCLYLPLREYIVMLESVLILFVKFHETTKANIERMNEKYRIAGSKGRKEIKLESGDLVTFEKR